MLFLVFFRHIFGTFVSEQEEASFKEWMKENSYCFTGEDYMKRLGIFITNKRVVNDFNQNHPFKLSLNKFAAFTNSEYQSLLQTTYPTKIPQQTETEKRNAYVPDSLDWRDFNIINSIKDLGAECGASWAFTAVTAQESAWAKKHGELYNLSASNLIDCCIYASGCNGGNPYDAFQYTNDYQNGQFMSEEDYPYTGSQGACRYDSTKAITSSRSYIIVNLNDEQDMVSKCAEYGVMCASIDASSFSFQLYKGGIFEDSRCSTWKTNLAVCVVGYGVEGDVPYWIIRNSWGMSWGEDGYMKLKRNEKSMCGIASMTFVPIAE
ncbi:Clan CA, family C1, cathepsin L-like cysteine peptidase [Histomonas meleagridis]|uniref:Clan CA, family C1, cathepsin L-like cysteine peptidase n=1 Tax=Histomonas meleagridis TaxID=135588 RepID=UPI00355A8857|nr:Clan CA, family C1, cathepsin L-like cysteine peptidase [Histomonas meleagridis]KAH0797329.1 Clan CA, family C1, cathepsin L-like cysteine peptidase [Histomonas meleagridis]